MPEVTISTQGGAARGIHAGEKVKGQMMISTYGEIRKGQELGRKPKRDGTPLGKRLPSLAGATSPGLARGKQVKAQETPTSTKGWVLFQPITTIAGKRVRRRKLGQRKAGRFTKADQQYNFFFVERYQGNPFGK